MCIGGRLGLKLDFDESALFAEVNGCLLIEVSPDHASAFETLFQNLPNKNIGSVLSVPVFSIRDSVSISVADLVHAFNTPNESLVSTL
jgi:hypothetical protein